MHPEKHILIKIFILLLITNILPFRLYAENSWWEKGFQLFDDLTTDENLTELSKTDMTKAFKEALQIASDTVINQVGQVNGFNQDPAIHVPLPEELETVRHILKQIGMQSITDDLELKLNRAAESASLKTKSIFYQAIKDIRFQDILEIYEGPDNSATLYFKNVMTTPLLNEMRPLVDETLSQVGVVKTYDQFMKQYDTFPFVPDVKSDLTEHVLEKGIQGLFYYMAIEEANIRNNPEKQTTELLKKVFGIR